MLESAFVFVGTPARPSCHCASIAELADDELFATWYAGSREGNADVAIMAARWCAGAWGEPQVLVDPPGRPGGNTVVYQHQHELWHFFDVIEGEGWSSAVLYRTRSTDGGRSWTPTEVFDAEPGMMVRHRPVRLSSGRILLPAYDEKTWEGLAYISDDGGRSWRRSGRMVASCGAIQPAIIERDDGTLHALLRSAGEATHAWECDSGDGGETWSRGVPSALHNPNSGADMIRLRGGQTIACFNDTPQGRTPLTLALSRDEGRTWAARRNIEDAPGEYSYPTLMEGSDGMVHLVYTWRRERIRWLRFEPEWIGAG
ncbi:MAG: exo-alpha-sialidase [Armatimonadota bacterium]